MSYYFDNKNRYQIIFPYTSDKIHVETDIDHGAFKCYQELKEQDVKTYLFMVHDIDSGMIYYFNIPKYKHLQSKCAPDEATHLKLNTQPELLIPQQTIQLTQQPQQQPLIQVQSLPQTQSQLQDNNQFNQKKQNEIITRLNHVEYQLESLKKMINKKPKKEEDGCTIQ